MNRPVVGVATIVCWPYQTTTYPRVLAQLRSKNLPHAPGVWCVPGGHLEPGETILEGALRELKEETGIERQELDRIQFWTAINNVIKEEDFHSITLFATAVLKLSCADQRRVLINPEPDKCDKLEWVDWSLLFGRPLMPCVEELFQRGMVPYTSNGTYWDCFRF